MPQPIRMSRRTGIAVWAVLCATGLVVTLALNASAEPDPQAEQPERPVSAECADYIADIDARLAEARQEGGGEDGVLAFARVRSGAEDCGDELRDHLSRGR
ncbi:hypothetical protein AB0E77_14555 [Streptomyces sp. NPDC032940]|uniref:hypothetical protein n=1 Tax=Streptomyces sp. NPDC032940 TaxID=3155366 RepID=UPI003408E4FA